MATENASIAPGRADPGPAILRRGFESLLRYHHCHVKKTPGNAGFRGFLCAATAGSSVPGGRPCCPAGGQGQATLALAANPDNRARRLSSSDGDCLRRTSPDGAPPLPLVAGDGRVEAPAGGRPTARGGRLIFFRGSGAGKVDNPASILPWVETVAPADFHVAQHDV